MEESANTERTSISTYLPAYQKAEWESHADDLGMSQSEFVRTMVQAGRKGFEPAEKELPSEGSDPGGNGLETRVLELLSTDTYSWDELLEAISDDVESRLDDAIGDLQANNRIRYSGRHDGYVLVGGDDGD
ncbi:DUF5805 domain-containing protein [Natrarchaeobius sp. A-rgal3]|uniref:DUF5805 domain-containing protein n=1 Tax=Natrarchaeobius versutus TaxID=1679078 RepID=UPI003510B32F